MAAKKKKRRTTSTSRAVSSSPTSNCGGCAGPVMFLYAVFLVVLGVLLWRGYSLERVFAVLFVVSGLKVLVWSFMKK